MNKPRVSSPMDDVLNLVEHLDRVPESWARNIAARLNRFVSGETDDVAAALDLKVVRGKRPKRMVSEVAARNGAIREIAETFFPGMRRKQQADELAAALRRYSTSAWRSDRQKQECPYKASDIRAALWLILTRVDHALSAERIRKILVMR
ncbi:hypothetical protein GGE45_005438 [Rhizobium aethiopicum]|uniref:hypothetical protein n=1 Tax=Rhizobium aethiopicum TaxID=1138170 RepID=UPI0016096E1C|nr:hypothetical protein [Rhizobium aethiopicum]MBB4583074.1 hypothetical protein [Rhizobium aethiopicum]